MAILSGLELEALRGGPIQPKGSGLFVTNGEEERGIMTIS